ncbi:NAD(P)/FAD-dependent oxidoreductase [Pseudomonas aeruginosa]|uniref:NAD(P)/FAD-dependent oxidoreductase n=1 Tax=Pseudomonas aeruginosa TaxID=287 RepID=UPI0024469389|nr:FAD-dependent oxidoreductase [Pseudomonas aeruginosa]MDG9818768.1 FAD-dependent oxidoreductase [Pseudomonas aeruginosa]MDG9933546.1 FAD-dependent oxidoreductase [Pseudomonas aeruginosa]MDH0526807.1 FAD-dependent oxidoreductase [Pseudomonas aeruginosa]MDH0532586.1 FAD-dependent oxidoreductase [Pseudomonas aeruginosa]
MSIDNSILWIQSTVVKRQLNLSTRTAARGEAKTTKKGLEMKHVVVIGAGVVGLSAAHHLLKDGAQVTLIDKDPEGDKASFGNAGGIAVTEVIPASVPGILWKVPGWLLDPLGPLALRPTYAPKMIPWFWRFSQVGSAREVTRIAAALAALNGRTYDDLLPMLADNGMSGELHRKGALTVYETEAAYLSDAGAWELKSQHGIEMTALTGEEVREMEPALSPSVKRGVFTPQWSHINDPKRFVDLLRQSLLSKGLKIVRGEITDVLPSLGNTSVTIKLKDSQSLTADSVVVAAGAWSGLLAKRLGDHVLLESERGYNTTIPNPGVSLSREVIFAERHFVATPLSCGLRIGGAAEFGGLEAEANYKRSEALVKLASIYLPNLKSEGGKSWAGHRPATPDSLPVIGRSPHHSNVFYAFGHGHLGLTQAASTGRLVSDLVFGIKPAIDVTPYSIERFH